MRLKVSYPKELRKEAKAQGRALFTFQLTRADGSFVEFQGAVGASDARALEIAASMVMGGRKLPELEELLRTARESGGA